MRSLQASKHRKWPNLRLHTQDQGSCLHAKKDERDKLMSGTPFRLHLWSLAQLENPLIAVPVGCSSFFGKKILTPVSLQDQTNGLPQ